MPRVNLDEFVWTDIRFRKLASLLDIDRHSAIGRWAALQNHVTGLVARAALDAARGIPLGSPVPDPPSSALVPADDIDAVTEKDGFAAALLGVGLAEEDAGSLYMPDMDGRIVTWYADKKLAARLGGLKAKEIRATTESKQRKPVAIGTGDSNQRLQEQEQAARAGAGTPDVGVVEEETRVGGDRGSRSPYPPVSPQKSPSGRRPDHAADVTAFMHWFSYRVQGWNESAADREAVARELDEHDLENVKARATLALKVGRLTPTPVAIFEAVHF